MTDCPACSSAQAADVTADRRTGAEARYHCQDCDASFLIGADGGVLDVVQR